MIFIVAGMLGSVTGIVITAIILTLEITQDYHFVLPIIMTTVIAYITRRKLSKESVYTLKLSRQGNHHPLIYDQTHL